MVHKDMQDEGSLCLAGLQRLFSSSALMHRGEALEIT